MSTTLQRPSSGLLRSAGGTGGGAVCVSCGAGTTAGVTGCVAQAVADASTSAQNTLVPSL
ncbi:MAG TPA: hypothetical protein VF761_08790 [Gemmatimonadaceae bacterium]